MVPIAVDKDETRNQRFVVRVHKLTYDHDSDDEDRWTTTEQRQGGLKLKNLMKNAAGTKDVRKVRVQFIVTVKKVVAKCLFIYSWNTLIFKLVFLSSLMKRTQTR